MGLVHFAEVNTQDSSFWGCEQRATVTPLDITPAAGFTGVVIVGKGKIGRGKEMVVGCGGSTNFRITSASDPKFALHRPKSVRNSLFSARGDTSTNNIHQNTFY